MPRIVAVTIPKMFSYKDTTFSSIAIRAQQRLTIINPTMMIFMVGCDWVKVIGVLLLGGSGGRDDV